MSSSMRRLLMCTMLSPSMADCHSGLSPRYVSLEIVGAPPPFAGSSVDDSAPYVKPRLANVQDVLLFLISSTVKPFSKGTGWR